MPGNDTPIVEQSGIGQWLRSAREAKGVSLEQAADVTRISKGYLHALEREEFDRLPGPAYCKGFLRIYAGYLGVSPDDAVSRYDTAVRGVAPVQKPVAEVRVARSDGPSKPRRSWVLPLSLLVVVILLSIFIDTDQRPPLQRPSPENAPPTQSAPVLAVSSSARKPPVFQPVSSPLPVASETAPPQLPAAEPRTGGVILRLKINQDSWLNVDIDGIRSKQYELKAGDLIEWKADSVITLDIGNAGGVEGELNGKPLPPLGGVGKKAHAVIRPEGAVLQ